MNVSPTPTVPSTLQTDGAPEGWVVAALSAVCEMNPSKPPADSLPPTTRVSFVPMAAVDPNSGAITDVQSRLFSEVRRGYTAFREDDVIFAKITPCMENGKAAIARGLQRGLGFGSTEFHVLRSNGAVLPEYLYHFIRQESFRRAAEERMTGSVGQRRVPVKFLQDAEIPVPPLPEQKRIVAKVEELIAHVRTARERLTRVSSILKRFRQSVLAAACAGRLTEDWRATHADRVTAERMLSFVRKRRAESVKGAPLPPFRGVKLEFPEGWRLVSLDELTARITSGSRAWKKYYREDGTGTFVMAQNVRPLFFDRSIRQRVEPPEDDPERERTQVAQDDLLVTIVGANTGDVCRVSDPLQRHYICQSVALIRPVLNILSPFLELYLNSHDHGRRQFDDWVYGEGRPHLSFDQLRTTAIAVPSFEEQRVIVDDVRRLFELADAVERRLSAVRSEKLTQAILAKAFRGELVPTDAELARQEGRDYEPAAALLERLKAGDRFPGSSHEIHRRP